jgi:hypothetical protein
LAKVKAPQLDSADVKRLLAKKHESDIFVEECKTGPAGSRSLDGWAMEKSWANPRIIGYEVKVSRSDFLRDTKWHEYLDTCNEFYFVTSSVRTLG